MHSIMNFPDVITLQAVVEAQENRIKALEMYLDRVVTELNTILKANNELADLYRKHTHS